MAEGLTEPMVLDPRDDSAPPPFESLFQRRIEFHPSRKTVSSFPSPGGREFYLETLNPDIDPHRQALSLRSPTASMAAEGKKTEDAEFFEHGLDSEFGFKITVRRIGAGLANLGNTCFLNSVLQCLTYTEPFAAYLQSGKHKSSCRTAGFCAMCALQNHVMDALQSTGKILSPLNLVKNLRCISRNFRNSRQEDAHEYMVNLLESMHKCCLPSGISSESPGAYEKSLVHKIFGGHLRSQVKCTQCSFSSNKFDPFLDLSLEIMKADSLHKALSHFTAVEYLDDGAKQYQCSRCKEKVRALKQLTIHNAPNVLSIHLKRFGSDVPGQKIDRKVEFGPTLDLKPFMSNPQDNLKYTLYGVLVHAGWSTHSGHYYCFVRTSSGLWHSLDDNQVSQVGEKTVLAQKAYMLFYTRDRSSNVAFKEKASSNFSGHRFVPRTSSALCEIIRNTMAEENSSVRERSAAPSAEYSANGSASVTNSSLNGLSKDRVMRDSISLQRNGCFKIENVSLKSEDNENIRNSNKPLGMNSVRSQVESCQGLSMTITSEKKSRRHLADNGQVPLKKMQNDPVLSESPPTEKNVISMINAQQCEIQAEQANGNILKFEKFENSTLQSGKSGAEEVLDAVEKNSSTPKCRPEQPRTETLKKFPSGIALYFGRKQMFYSSIKALKCKKHKKGKKRRLKMKERIVVQTKYAIQNDQKASTSEASKAKDARAKKRSSLHIDEATNFSCASDSMNIKAMETEANCRCSTGAIESVSDKRPKNPISFMNLLTRGWEETVVAKWEDADSPSFLSNRTEGKRNGVIGYVLDEWDEEYDRGRRKKMKKTENSFDGSNPFQQIADMKVKHLKMKMGASPSSWGTKPYRI